MPRTTIDERDFRAIIYANFYIIDKLNFDFHIKMNLLTLVYLSIVLILLFYIMHYCILKSRKPKRNAATETATIRNRTHPKIPRQSNAQVYHPFQRPFFTDLQQPHVRRPYALFGTQLINEPTVHARAIFAIDAMNPIILGDPTSDVRPIAAANREDSQKIDKIQNYMKEIGKIRSDSQNVHDTQLIKELGVFYNSLPKYNTVDKEEIVDYIMQSENLNEEQKLNALRALEAFDTEHTISSLNTNLHVVLATVWKNGYRDETLNALVDCTEHNSLVCVTGRCNKLLYEASLKNNNTAPAMTQDAYKHQIVNEVQNIIRAKIDEIAKSPNAKLRAVAESYTNPEIPVDAATEEEFKNALKDDIRAYISAEYTSKLTPAFLTKMQEYCQLAVV